LRMLNKLLRLRVQWVQTTGRLLNENFIVLKTLHELNYTPL
jgi:hypothetical protein